MKLNLIYEDDSFLVLNKPSGVVIHPYDFSTEETLLDAIKEYSPECFTFQNVKTLQDGRKINLGGIVHKLDRDTSGVIVIAKNENVFNELREQFKGHVVQKEYLAIVEGIIEKDKFTIDSPLGRNKKDYKQSTNPTNPRGELRSAITDVEVITSRQGLEVTTLVKLRPKTGRTHQLRAHMASIGHPIVGDKIYDSKINSPRIMLHAQRISFNLNNKTYKFETLTPDDFNLETTK